MKPWIQSRTIWLQFIQLANAVLLLNEELKAFPDLVPKEWLGAITAVVAIATIIVRFNTSQVLGANKALDKKGE